MVLAFALKILRLNKFASSSSLANKSFYNLSKNLCFLGVIDTKSEKIILFDKNGIHEGGIDFTGNTGFVIEKDTKTNRCKKDERKWVKN